ncbi:MAG TPA: hypothetical protein VLW85_06560 [Myxococcales bacterium]|nr:hypothetical protein [Myxococcales bacterium]
MLPALLLILAAAAEGQKAPPTPVEKALPLPAAPAPMPGADIPLALPGPPLPPLDLSLLKDTSLCVFPFLKESQGGVSDKQYLASVQQTFFDVAKQSPLIKDAILLGQSSLCDPHDARCFADAGKLAHCQNVLVGNSAAKGNGFVLSVRIFEVGKGRVMPGSEVEQVLETDRQSDVQAWAEGQACRALQVKCVGKIQVDADMPEMNIYIDNRLAPRAHKSPEQIAVEPGVHGVRIAVGQRTSLEKKVAVRRNQVSEIVYARQTDKGGLPLVLASELRGAKPEGSVEYSEGGWKKPVGYTVAGVGLVAIGVGIFEGSHGKSLLNQASSSYTANGGAYSQADLANVDSGRSAVHAGNALFIVGGVLLAAGLVTAFVF